MNREESNNFTNNSDCGEVINYLNVAKEGVENFEIPSVSDKISTATTPSKVEHVCGANINCIESALVDETSCRTTCRAEYGITNAKLKSNYYTFCTVTCEDEPCYYCCTEISCTKAECTEGTLSISDVACLEPIT